jgi:nucleotide-sensitive chloride channel 1A
VGYIHVVIAIPAWNVSVCIVYLDVMFSRRVIWSGADEAHDFDAAYIVLHAITHDPESYPKPCIYIQFDVDVDGAGGGLDDEDDSEEGEDSEAFVVPADPEQREQQFEHIYAYDNG